MSHASRRKPFPMSAAESYALQGYDGEPVEFTWSEIREVPYASDILVRGESDVLPATNISGQILFEVQKLLRLKQEFNVSLVPQSPVLRVGGLRLTSPPVSYYAPWDAAVPCWPAEFKAVLGAYTLHDLLKILRALDFLCMRDYRTAVVHRLLWVLHNAGETLTEFHAVSMDVLCSNAYFQRLLEWVFDEGVTASSEWNRTE